MVYNINYRNKCFPQENKSTVMLFHLNKRILVKNVAIKSTISNPK